jgi:large conductance mechanosensitive channel
VSLTEKGAQVLKGFKDFLMRGNIIDLAVAVVVGSAFTALVTAFTSSIIKPLIAATGGSNVAGIDYTIVPGNPASTIHIADVINAIITFFITAAVVYFLFVVPMKKLQNRRNKTEEKDPTEAELLLEIRDLLRREQGLPKIKGLDTEEEKEKEKAAATASNGSKPKGSTS